MQFLAVIMVILIAAEIVVKTQKKQSAAGKTGGRESGSARPAPNGGVRPPQPAEKAAPTHERTFVSLEGTAEETRWHDTVMGEEGSDPCHDEMFTDIHAEESVVSHANAEAARELARAVVMAEILKRPSERRWSARGGK